MRPARVLEHVRQRFLDDPERGQLDTGRKTAPLSLDPQLDVHAGVAHLGDEPVDVGQRRLRGERLRLSATEDAEQPPELDERLSSCRLDRAECLLRGRRGGVEHASLGSGLHHHHADLVRDDVVELARDRRPLELRRLADAELLLTLEHLGTRRERLDTRFALVDDPAHDDHREQRDTREDDRASDELVKPCAREADSAEHDAAADEEVAPVGPDGEPVERGDPGAE